MKRLFILGCAALTLAFASCSSNKKADQTNNTENATEQTTEATTTEPAAATETPAAAQQEVKDAVNQVLVDLQNKLNAFKAKVEASKKIDAPKLMTEAKALSDEITAASLTDEEKQGLKDTFNSIVELCKNLK